MEKNLSHSPITILAHRGVRYQHLENTLNAFLAVSQYQESHPHYLLGIELDLMLSQDNQVIVFHDYNLERLHQENEEVKNLSSEILEEKYEIPTLEKVLFHLSNQQKNSIFYDLEIKMNSEDLNLIKSVIDKTIKLVEKYNISKDKYILTSFNAQAIKYIKETYPDILTGKMIDKEINLEYDIICSDGIDNFDIYQSELVNKRKKMFTLFKNDFRPLKESEITPQDIAEIEKIIHHQIDIVVTDNIEKTLHILDYCYNQIKS